MKSDKDRNSLFSNAFRLGMDKLLWSAGQVLPFLRSDREHTGYQFKEIFNTTSDLVREKAEVTKRAVKLRMAVLELEHHLNRLYPQIGKITCDLAAEGKKTILQDEALKSRIELAAEYRQRLQKLKEEQEAHHQHHKKRA